MSDALPRTFDPAPADRGLNRRQLVKAGVWAAPAVVLTTAVPAAMASGALSLAFSSPSTMAYTWSSTAATGLGGTISALQLSGSTGNPSRITGFTIVVAVNGTDISMPVTPVITSGSGWSAGAASISGATTTFTFTNSTEVTVSTGQTVPVPGFSFTLAGGSAFTTPASRGWNIMASATAVTASTSVGTASASGALTAGDRPVTLVSGPTKSPGTSNNKDVVVSVTTSANSTVVARLTVTPKAKQDNFVTTPVWTAGTITPGATDLAADVATTNSMAAGQNILITFPAYSKQSADVTNRPYKIEFFLNGSAVPFAPATISGADYFL